ncbi:M20/M25/M40 family metallo-hydrolase [Kibdelosporangium persicum]|uniref:Succinyl-diaminopimelate desuccinylase n=2 Tax=Kibdelosporangium persicum TaxID=2698649 RepID=A0ABX2FI48_9PSEU|nr:M20/M25/M40 family metallo-hydrolase [Kibdelosporangium persicum]NRN71096.1 Succinyl-diaminopimelate desuccinylase [Kibdelosporangium persicum]
MGGSGSAAAEAEFGPVMSLQRMVSIPSPTGGEGELADYLVGTARRLGLAAWRDEVGNFVAERTPGGTTRSAAGAGSPTVLLLGHMDTVPGMLPVRLRDGVLHGRGAVDAKGPLAAMIWAAAKHSNRTARVRVVGAVGEEGDSPGARHLLAEDRPDAVVIGEPSGVGNVVLGYKGVIWFKLEITRPARHSSRPEPKAVEVAVEFAHDVRAYVTAHAAGDRMFDRPIATVTELTGTSTGARVVLGCRTPIGFDSKAFRTWLRDRAGDDELTVIEEVPAVLSSRTDPMVAALSQAVGRFVGRPTAKVKLGTSDMNVVGPVWSVPIAAYGPGDSRLDHTDEERIEVAEFLTSIDVLSHALDLVSETLARRHAAVRPC